MRFAVLGNPISHSLSPAIHNAFADQLGLSIEYLRLCVEKDQLASVIHDFFSQHGAGLNITVPFKELVRYWVEDIKPTAQTAGAINTIGRHTDGSLWGDNTDGQGFIRDIVHNHKKQLEHQRILILGAGGAVRGIMAPLLQQTGSQVIVANRSAEKAQQIKSEFQALGHIDVVALDDLAHCGPVDWLINAIPMAQSHCIFPFIDQIIDHCTNVYDLSYCLEYTPLCQWLNKSRGIMAFDGLGMLVEQAALSFALWHHKSPDTKPVIDSLNKRRTIKLEH